MKISMKKIEKDCGDYAERWNKKALWDQYILVKGAWLDGYKKARQDVAEGMRNSNKVGGFNQSNYNASDEEQTRFMEYYIQMYVDRLGEDVVEVDIISNQIGGGRD